MYVCNRASRKCRLHKVLIKNVYQKDETHIKIIKKEMH